MRLIGAIVALVAAVGVSLVSGEESEVASTFGYTNKSEKVSTGPYTLHYGESQDGSLYLLARGNHNIISSDGYDTSVYKNGRPWLSFTTDATGTVTNISLTVTDAQGKMIATMIDENADGQWDLKIDMVQKKVFEWRGGKWTPRETKKTANKVPEVTARQLADPQH